MNLAIITLSIGLIIFFSYLLSSIFEKYQIPDVLFLLIIGLILGPITNIIDVDQFGILGNLFATLTLLIILFEAGLNIRLKQLASTAGQATTLMFLTLVFSIASVIPFSMIIFGLSLLESILVGIVVGGVSAGIVIPVAEKLPVTEKTKTLLALESNINDILTISMFIAILEFLNSGVFNLKEFLTSFGIEFSISLLVGIIIAVIWSQLMNNIRGIENNIFMTPALVLTVYGATELLGMSGMISVFAFGITLGNLQFMKFNKLTSMLKFEKFHLTKWEKNMFSGFVFLLKTYFFIYIGLSIKLDNTLMILVGAFVTIVLFGARFLAVKLSTNSKIPKFDKQVLMKLMPKGLVGAALVTLVANQSIQDFAYSMILFSILFTSILIFLIPKEGEDKEEAIESSVKNLT